MMTQFGPPSKKAHLIHNISEVPYYYHRTQLPGTTLFPCIRGDTRAVRIDVQFRTYSNLHHHVVKGIHCPPSCTN